MRFNLGGHTPVEGYSNFLWVALAALVEWVGARADSVMPLLSLASGLGLLASFYDVARARLGVSEHSALAGGVFLAAAPGFVVWGTGGLATLPAAWMLWVTFDALVLDSRRSSWLRGVVAGTALALLRTEGVAWVVVIACLGTLARLVNKPADGEQNWGSLGRAVVGVAGAFGLFLLWRYSVYQDWVANTAHVKVGFSMERLGRGWDYLFGFWLTSPALPASLLGSIPAWLIWRWRAIPVIAMALGPQAYAVVVGGDFMTMGRLLVPCLAFAALLVSASVAWAERRAWDVRGVWLVVVGVVVVGALPLDNVHVVPETIRSGHNVRFNTAGFRSEFEQWRFMRSNALVWSRLGRALHTIEEPGDSIVLGAIGAVAYHSDLFVYDRYGLVTRSVAMREVKAGGRSHSPGHDKHVPIGYFVDEKPTFAKAKLLSARELGSAEREVKSWVRGSDLAQHFGPRLDPVTLDGRDWYLLSLEWSKSPKRRWDRFDQRVTKVRESAARAAGDASR